MAKRSGHVGCAPDSEVRTAAGRVDETELERGRRSDTGDVPRILGNENRLDRREARHAIARHRRKRNAPQRRLRRNGVENVRRCQVDGLIPSR